MSVPPRPPGAALALARSRRFVVLRILVGDAVAAVGRAGHRDAPSVRVEEE